MDFYTHKDNALRRSRALFVRFCLANIILLVLLNCSLFFVVQLFLESPDRYNSFSHPTSSTDVFLYLLPFMMLADSATLITVVIAAVTHFKKLSAHGGSVAEAIGAARVPPDTVDPLEMRYLNVVEEMAIAANVPVPQVYIMADEKGINAFASGPSPDRSAVAVTRGALERLSRDELQGVVAHEFSHITHGDVGLNIKLSAYVFGLLALFSIGRFILEVVVRSGRSARRSDDNSGAAPLALIATLVAFIFFFFGLLGRLVSVLMSAAISRQREFLADATAVQLTRNPSGIANALKKIGGFQHGAIIKTSRAESMAHFFLANSQRPSFFSALYASHPPLAERISRIDPSFTGEFPESNGIELQSGYEGVQISGFHSSSTLSNQTPSQQGEEGSGSASSTRASEWMPPTELRSSFIGLGTAESAVLAVLMDKDPRERKVQSQIIAAFTSPEGVETKRQELCDLSVNQRLSVVMMAMPSIHGEAHQYRKAFRETVSQLIRVDEHVTRLEFLVGTLVEFASDDSAPSDSLWRLSSGPSEAELIQYIEVLLSVCASFTSQDPNECSILVAEASARLGVPCTYQQAAADDIPGFLRAVSWLREASGEIRRQLVASFDGIMRRDGTITELERALSRTFAMLLKAEALYRL